MKVPMLITAITAAAIIALAAHDLFAWVLPVQADMGSPLGTAATAVPTPAEPCPEWKKAGVQVIYKCEDDDNGVACYVPVGGVMQCLRP